MATEVSAKISDQIRIFKEKGSVYSITKSRKSKGQFATHGQEKNIYWLTKVMFPSFNTVKIRISSAAAKSLAGLPHDKGMALCEQLVSEQLCKGCKGQKSREPPFPGDCE